MSYLSLTRIRAGACATLTVLTCAGAVAPAHAHREAATRPLVHVLAIHDVHARPDPASPRHKPLEPRRPITGARTVLPRLKETTGTDGRSWLKVMLPGRPNGRTGWIAAHATLPGSTAWALRVDLSQRRVTVLHSGRPARSFRGIVGTSQTPTPRGRFFVEETVKLARRTVGAPFALALSARSTVLEQFAGGPGQIALHGLGNVGGTLGAAMSHGCVRLEKPAITWLARRIGPGVPVTITS